MRAVGRARLTTGSTSYAGSGLLAIALLAIGPSLPTAALAAPIYSCVDGNGKRLTSDRPIAECTGREQRVLNTDGSIREVLPPTLTAEERAAREQREREAETERAARQDALRRDRNLLIRFPDAATHHKAREAALDDVRKSVQLSQSRVALLANERRPLLDEAEFYVGQQMPGKLRAQLDANDASAAAQKNLIQNQQIEIVRINTLYDAELERLKKLWAGAPPGSMGKLPAALPPAGLHSSAASAPASASASASASAPAPSSASASMLGVVSTTTRVVKQTRH